jgi:hypothetical protein
METSKNWQLTTRYRCPKYNKRYTVADWKHNPKCRQSGAALRADDQQGAPPLAKEKRADSELR